MIEETNDRNIKKEMEDLNFNFKLDITINKLDDAIEMFEFRKKTFKSITIFGSITLLIIIVMNMFTKLNALNCFSISLLTCTLYHNIYTYCDTVSGYRSDIRMALFDLNHLFATCEDESNKEKLSQLIEEYHGKCKKYKL